MRCKMKICELTYQQARSYHPEEVEKTIQKLRSGNSKFKNADGSKLIWWYEAAIQVKAYSFSEMLSGAYHSDQNQFDALNQQDKLNDLVERVYVDLAAKTDNRWCNRIGIERKSFTPQILEWVKNYANR